MNTDRATAEEISELEYDLYIAAELRKQEFELGKQYDRETFYNERVSMREERNRFLEESWQKEYHLTNRDRREEDSKRFIEEMTRRQEEETRKLEKLIQRERDFQLMLSRPPSESWKYPLDQASSSRHESARDDKSGFYQGHDNHQGRRRQRSTSKHHRRVYSDSSSEEESSDFSSLSEEESDSEPDEHYGRRRTSVGSRRDEGRRHGSRRGNRPPPPKMETFCGESHKWKSFKFLFKQTAKIHKWNSRTKLERLMACLRDQALEYVRTRPSSVQRVYKRLMKSLTKRYGQTEPPSSYRKQLYVLKQEESESLDDFADRVYVLTMDGYPDVEDYIVQELAADSFLRGCRDRQAAAVAGDKEPKTINQAVSFVKKAIDNYRSWGIKGSEVYTRQVHYEDEDRQIHQAVPVQQIQYSKNTYRCSPSPARRFLQRQSSPQRNFTHSENSPEGKHLNEIGAGHMA